MSKYFIEFSIFARNVTTVQQYYTRSLP